MDYKIGKYEEKNGVLIPAESEVFWILKGSDFSYAKFKIKKIEYNKADIF